jgi:pilus assembly protein FimV
MNHRILLAGLLCLVSPWAQALGLGDITLHSSLGQPLRGEINLYASEAELASEPRVRNAPREAYERAGLYKSSVASKLRFQVETGQDGKPVIKVSSKDSVNEPTLTFMLEVTWAGGQVLRQYSVHLNPVK